MQRVWAAVVAAVAIGNVIGAVSTCFVSRIAAAVARSALSRDLHGYLLLGASLQGLRPAASSSETRLGARPAVAVRRSAAKACSADKRNATTFAFNPRRLYPLVDYKLKTKCLALQAASRAGALWRHRTQHDFARCRIRSQSQEFDSNPHCSAGAASSSRRARGNRYRTIAGTSR